MADNEPLAKMVLQPAAEQAGIAGESTYTESWKGPWEEIKLITSTQKVMGTTLIVGQKRPNFSNGSWQFETQPPTPLSPDWPWVVQDISISQEASGLNGYLTIEYKSQTPDVDNADPDSGTDPQEKEDYQKELTEARAWTLTWQPYNRNVLEYSTMPDSIMKFKEHPASAPWSYYKDATTGAVATIPDTDSNKERKIATYYAKDVAPQFHYPVVTFHQEYTLPEGKDVYTAIGSELDKKTSLPNECPFKSKLSTWQWVMVADTGTIASSKRYKVSDSDSSKPQLEMRYVRETSWQGSKMWDDNFYGQNAWQPIG